MRSAGSRSGVNWRRWNGSWQACGQRLDDQRLGQAGQALEEHVPAGQERHREAVHQRLLADHLPANLAGQGVRPRHRRRGAIAPRSCVTANGHGGVAPGLLAGRAHTRTVRSAPAETRRVPPGAKASAVTPPSCPSSRASSRAVMTSRTRIDVASPATAQGAAVVGEREMGGVADGAERAAGFGIPEHHRPGRRRAAGAGAVGAGDRAAGRRARRRRRGPTCPGPCATNDRIFSPFAFHNVSVPSPPPDRMVCPSGAMARAEA